MNRTSITIVVVVLLCAAGFAYSQGWLDWSRPVAKQWRAISQHQPGVGKAENEWRHRASHATSDGTPDDAVK